MSKHHTTATILRVTTLSAALLMAFGAAPARSADVTFQDGAEHSVTQGTYDFVYITYKTGQKALLTTLNASNVKVDDSRVDGNSGAVFAKGATINISDSEINTTGKRSGLQAFSSRNGEAATTVVGNRVQITTEGDSAHGAFLYFERNGEARRDTNLTINDSTIITSGSKANGLIVGGTGDAALDGNGVLTANNVIINTTGKSSTGVFAQFLGVADLNGTNITTTGEGAVGAHADASGGTITLDQSSITTKTGYGMVAVGSDSTITSNDTSVLASDGPAGAYATNGAHIILNGGSIENASTKAGAMGIQADGAGSRIDATNVAIKASGEYFNSAEPSNVVSASQGASISLTGGSATSLSSKFARGILVSTGASVTATDVAISTKGIRSHAVQAWSGSKNGTDGITDKPIIDLTGGTVDTTGADSAGLMAQNNGSTISATNTRVTTKGADSYGAIAYNGSTVALKKVAITTSGARAHGISMGATSFVETPSKEPVSNLASIITVTGGSIIATGQDASSAYLQDSGSVTLNGVRLESASAAITSNLKQAEQTQDITVGAGSNLTVNNGTLLQVNRSDVAMDGIVNLTLKANSVAAGDIVDLDGLVPGGSETRSKGGKTNFNLESGAKWTGLVRGINDVTAGDGGTFVDEGGAPISGNVIGGTNSTVTFTNGSTISGNVQTATGSNATFNGPSSIGGNVAGTGSNYTFGDTANIGGNVTGTGSVFGFSGPTTIGGNVNGSNTSFNFSPTAQTTINGDVLLTDGSTTHGGSIQTPVSISGDVAVQNSTLGGNLNVGGTVSSQGGIFNPGNSVGTQTFESVGTLTDTEYRAEINAAGQSDKIVINTGNIDIGDVKLTVAQENGNGGYLINHDYTILQTKAGVVENEFRDPTLAANFGDLLKLNVKYDNPAEVRVGLSVDDDAIATERAGWSDNQNATYDGLMSASAGNTLATAALMDPDVKNALNQLSGEVHASTQTALMNSSGVVARTLSNRMRSNLGAGMVAGAPTAQAYGATAGSMPRSAAYPLWAEVVGNWSSLDGNNNTAKTKTDIGGLFIGGDAAVGSSGWRLGGALGFTDGKIKTDDRNSRSDVTSYTAALYGGNSWETAKGKVNFLAGAAYTRHDVDSRRSVTVGGNQTLKASYDVNTTQLFTELGYALPVGAASTIEPYVGLAWLSQDAKSFKESGGSAALSGKSQKDDITTFTLGLRGKTTVDVGANQASLMAGLGWRHAAGDVDATRTMSFIQGNGAGFKVAGAPIAKNAAVLDLAAEMGVGRNAAMGLSYAGQFGDGNTDSAGTVYLKVKF